jgi:hypothetical protein
MYYNNYKVAKGAAIPRGLITINNNNYMETPLLRGYNDDVTKTLTGQHFHTYNFLPSNAFFLWITNENHNKAWKVALVIDAMPHKRNAS